MRKNSFDPPENLVLLHHYQDPALRQPYGEGTEIWFYRDDQNRYYRKKMFRHIDADSDSWTQGWIDGDAAVELLASFNGEKLLLQLFPDAWQARTYRRFGTCSLRELESRIDSLLQEAVEVVTVHESITEEPREPCTLFASPTGLFLTCTKGKARPPASFQQSGIPLTTTSSLRFLLGRHSLAGLSIGDKWRLLLKAARCSKKLPITNWNPHGEPSGRPPDDENPRPRILTPPDALRFLCRHGCSAQLFHQYFPDAPETLFLIQSDAENWLQARKTAIPRALETAELLYRRPARKEAAHATSGPALYRLDEHLHLLEEPAHGTPPHYEFLDRPDALFALIRMGDVPDEVKMHAFPHKETWRTMQERTGIQFPADGYE